MGDGILITGGAGFIGCALAAALVGNGTPIVAVDNLHPQIHPDRQRPKVLPEAVDLEVGDVRDADFWRDFFARRRPDVIVHLAAETGTGQSLTESARHAGVNVTGTAEMIDAMTAAGIRPRHILLASSRAVYGEGAWRGASGAVFYPGRRPHERLASGAWGFVDEGGNPTQPLPHRAGETVPMPTSVYGATKLAQEHILGAWAAAMDVPLSILRFQNVYGPGQSPFNAYTGIITLFHRVARAGQPIDVYEDGLIGRDFVFVDDVVAACVAALANAPASLRTIDVGSGVPTTILDAARVIAGLHAAPAPAISGKFRDGDVRWAVCDPVGLKDLGIHSKVGFAEGCRRVGEWLIAEGYA